MGSSVVFVYLVIAAVAAPFLWLMWSAADSLGGTGRLHATAAPIRSSEVDAGARRTIFKQPQPADISLARPPSGAVTIHRLADATRVDSCVGPDSSGRCPRALADGSVPCAGAVLALPCRIRGSAEWHIPSGYQTCLLGSYDAFRQEGSPT